MTGSDAVRFPPSAVNDRLEHWAPERQSWLAVRDVAKQTNSTTWARAATLQLEQQDFARSPGTANVRLSALVEASRDSGILLPSTSYIVVENQAQWRMLEQSEAQKLGQNAALEFRETPAPPAAWIAVGLTAFVVLRRRLKRSRGEVASPKALRLSLTEA